MLICIFGKRGSGKTTIIRGLIPKQRKPVIILDILGNYDHDPEHAETEKWTQCESHLEALHELKNYLREPAKHPGIIVVRDSDINRCADFMCSALWKIEGGTLVLDEADALRESEAPCFDEAIRYGRNKNIDVITGCRRPAEISRNITAGADVAYCLSTQEPRDIEYYENFLGEELALALPHLPPHHGVYKDFMHQTQGTFRADQHGKIFIEKKKEAQKSQPLEPKPKSEHVQQSNTPLKNEPEPAVPKVTPIGTKKTKTV